MRISDWSSDVCSSDLEALRRGTREHRSTAGIERRDCCERHHQGGEDEPEARPARETSPRLRDIFRRFGHPAPATRSAEHTSELQSLMRISYAVFCLKKKTRYKKLT